MPSGREIVYAAVRVYVVPTLDCTQASGSTAARVCYARHPVQ
jgi:hypothetical protein